MVSISLAASIRIGSILRSASASFSRLALSRTGVYWATLADTVETTAVEAPAAVCDALVSAPQPMAPATMTPPARAPATVPPAASGDQRRDLLTRARSGHRPGSGRPAPGRSSSLGR